MSIVHHDIPTEDLRKILEELMTPERLFSTRTSVSFDTAWRVQRAIGEAGYQIRTTEATLTEPEVRILAGCAQSLMEKVHQHERTMGVDQHHNHHACIAVRELVKKVDP